MVRRTAQLVRTSSAACAEFILEHPADRGALSSQLFLHKRHAPIWPMPDIQALRTDCSASLISFPQCALGAPSTQKYTSHLVLPMLTPALQSLSNLRCQHHSHRQIAGGSKSSVGWRSCAHAAYPPDFKFLIAMQGLGHAPHVQLSHPNRRAEHCSHSTTAAAARKRAHSRYCTSAC
eukprot:1120312-Pleurochrysis_carterae.AAC.1